MRRVYMFFLWVGIMGCVEPYDFQVDETVEVLVVEAEFSDQQTNHQVKLSISSSLTDSLSNPVSGATVSITEDGNLSYACTEVEQGVYETDATIAGKVGSSYVLEIILSDGSAYRSTAEVLAAPVAIDSVYGRYLELPSEESDGLIQGVQLFVDTHDPNTEESYFRYEYQEDYEVRAAFPSLEEWNPDTESYSPRDIPIGICYEQKISQGIQLATTSGLAENRLSEFPIRMIEQKGPELIGRYAMILKQYSISANTFQYYKNLKKNNESAGSFFDKQKGTISGNVSSTDASRLVLGYFEVAGVSSDTTFFSRNDFDHDGFRPDRYNTGNCTQNDLIEVSTGELNNELMQGRNIVMVDLLIGVAKLTSIPCSDCRVYADIKKPDYWD